MKFFLSLLAALFFVTTAHAETINVAVASNALNAIRYLAGEYSSQTGNKVNISSGSTGKLYAQIINGAPFDVFLAANAREPQRLESEGYVVNGTRFTYAVGNLSLCAYQPATAINTIEQGIALLRKGDYQRLAIASPKVAPYGIAAKEFLQASKLWQQVQPKLIQGENINQTFRYVMSGNVQYAIVALSQTKQAAAKQNLACLAIPPSMYTPLKQQSVTLKHAKDSKAVQSFVSYLKQDNTRKLLLDKFGYAAAGNELAGVK